MTERDKEREAGLIFLDAVEAAITQYRMNVGAKTQPPKQVESFDPDKIAWTPTKNRRDEPFEVSRDYENPEYKRMFKLLQDGGGFTKAGLFYWIMQDGKTVGRKARRKQE